MRHEIINIADRLEAVQPGDVGAASTPSAILTHPQRLANQAADRNSLNASSAEFVRGVLRARIARAKFLNSDLFADPAWDILLELYALHCEQRRTSVSKLCIAAAVPATTALRWIDKLQSDGLIKRQEDPLDARRAWVTLTSTGLAAMTAYLNHLEPGAMPV